MLSLTYFFALGLILVFTHGHFSPTQLPALVALHVGYSVVAIRRPGTPLDPAARRGVLAIALLGFGLFLAYNSQLIYPTAPQPLHRLMNLLALVPVLAVGALVAARFLDRLAGRVGFAVCVGATIALLVAARVLVLSVSPRPFIDVWTSSQQAVEYFLAGKNPYAQPYVDIYQGRYDYFASFPYWPGYLLWATAGAIALPGAHDVRASLVVAELLAAGGLFLFMRKLRFDLWTGGLVVAVWLAFPIDLFIEEQAWIDPLLLLGFAGAAWMLAGKRFIAAGLFLGFACATKQYVFIGCGFFLVFVFRQYGRKAALQLLISAAALFFVLLLPFAIADWGQFYKYTVSSWAGALPRGDSLSVVAFVANQASLQTPEELKSLSLPFTLLSLLALAGFLFWLARKKLPTLREMFVAATGCYGFVLLFAKQSFCNYYYFMSFFIMAALCASWSEQSTPSP